MEKNLKKKKATNSISALALLGAIAIVVLGFLAFFAADQLLAPPRGGMMQTVGGDLIFFRSLLTLLIMGFSFWLVYVYLKDYIELRNELTLGILFSVIAFMLFGISSTPQLHMMLRMGGGGVFDVVPLLFAAIALAILAWVSAK